MIFFQDNRVHIGHKIEMRVVTLGLDDAGKTSILFKMKQNEFITTIPTIGKYYADSEKDCQTTEISIFCHLVRKPTICICESKDADQLCSNCEADQRLCFCYTDSIILQLAKFKISSL